MPDIMYNAIQTPDGTILESHWVHDYKEHLDQKTNRVYMVDGGRSYLRRSAHGDEVDLSLYSDAPHKQLRDVVTWGTRGKNGDQPLKWVPVCDMETDHIEACLETQSQMSESMRRLLEDELAYRADL